VNIEKLFEESMKALKGRNEIACVNATGREAEYLLKP
jgi:hypothetical protein